MKNKITVVVSTLLILAVVAIAIVAFAKLPVISLADGTVSGNSVEADQIAAEQRVAKFINDIDAAQKNAVQQATFCYAIASANGTQVVFPQNPLTVNAGAVATYPTAIVRTDEFFFFNQAMMNKVKANTLLNYEIHYKYQGHKYVLVIPAGADYSLIFPSNGYYGFKYLECFFGGYEEF